MYLTDEYMQEVSDAFTAYDREQDERMLTAHVEALRANAYRTDRIERIRNGHESIERMSTRSDRLMFLAHDMLIGVRDARDEGRSRAVLASMLTDAGIWRGMMAIVSARLTDTEALIRTWEGQVQAVSGLGMSDPWTRVWDEVEPPPF